MAVRLRSRGNSGRRLGFTLVEILISLVVLLVAIAGILSLLVASTRQAGEVVEDTYAATLARSVFEAVRVGVRERSFAIDRGDGVIVRGFVLDVRTGRLRAED